MYTFKHIKIHSNDVYFQLDEKADKLFCPFATIQGSTPEQIKTKLKNIVGVSFTDSSICIENASEYMKKNIPKIVDTLSGVRTRYNPLFMGSLSSAMTTQSAPSLPTHAPLSLSITHSDSSPRLRDSGDLTLDSLIPGTDPNLEGLYRKTTAYKSQIFTQAEQTSTGRHAQKAVVTSAILCMGYTVKFNLVYHAIKHQQVLKLSAILDNLINPIFLERFPESAPSSALCDYFRKAVAFVMDNEAYNHNSEPTYEELELGREDLTYTPEMKSYREANELEGRANTMLQHWLFLISDDSRLSAAIASSVTPDVLMTLKQLKFAIKLNSTTHQNVQIAIEELRALIIESGKIFRHNKLAFVKIETQYKNHEPIRSAASTDTNSITFVSFRAMMVKQFAEYNLTKDDFDEIFLSVKIMLSTLLADTNCNAGRLIEKLHASDKDFYLLDEWSIGFIAQWQLNLEPIKVAKSLRKKESAHNLFALHFTEQFRRFVLTKIAESAVSNKTVLSKSMGV